MQDRQAFIFLVEFKVRGKEGETAQERVSRSILCFLLLGNFSCWDGDVIGDMIMYLVYPHNVYDAGENKREFYARL